LLVKKLSADREIN